MKAETTVQTIAERPPAGWSDRLTPRVPDMAADVWVPLAQAAAIGGIAAVLLAAPVALVGGDVKQVVLAWAGVAAPLTVACFIWRLKEYKPTLYARELSEGRDLNGDGRVGAPAQPAPLVWVRSGNGYVQAPPDEAERRDFIVGCYGTIGTAWNKSDGDRRGWDGKRFVSTGQKVTRDRWKQLTDELVNAGLLVSHGARRGATLRGSVDDALAKFDLPALPHSENENYA